jgi:hypothetical protein
MIVSCNINIIYMNNMTINSYWKSQNKTKNAQTQLQDLYEYNHLTQQRQK